MHHALRSPAVERCDAGARQVIGVNVIGVDIVLRTQNRRATPQALAWPRWSFVDMKGRTIATGVPQVVKDAQCEAALAHLSTSLASPLDRGGSISEVQVGPIDVKYSPGAASSRTFAYIDALVSDVALSSTAAQVSLIRG